MPAIRTRSGNLSTGLVLAGAGGFLDAYTFVNRGGVPPGTQAASKVRREVIRPLAIAAMSIPRTADGGPLGGPNIHGSAAGAPDKTYSGGLSGAKMSRPTAPPLASGCATTASSSTTGVRPPRSDLEINYKKQRSRRLFEVP